MNTKKERMTIVQTMLDLLRELGEEGEIALSLDKSDKQLIVSTKRVNHETREVDTYEINIGFLDLAFGPDNVLKHRLSEIRKVYQNAV